MPGLSLNYLLLIECTRKELPWIKVIVNHFTDKVTTLGDTSYIEASVESEDILRTVVKELSKMSIKNMKLVPIKVSESGAYEVFKL